ncbi:MAG: Na+/H+ antiporter NhaA [Acidobacteriaceae bacterium]
MSRKRIPVARRPMVRWTRPFLRFAEIESAGGLVLLACTVIALVWANSSAADFYAGLLHLPITIGISHFYVAEDLHFWINDGLMAVFFLFAGLEIKHEMLVGELSSFKLAALPVFAAIGGVVFPAGIYIALNHGRPTAGGWGIPMATDIAFALGILAISGSRAPVGLKVFLTALAIVDDIAAVLVIAFFYSSAVHWHMLLAAFGFLAIGVVANRVGVTYVSVYLLIGLGVWYCMLRSGVHATIAGVLVALIVPSSRYLEIPEFLQRAREDLLSLEQAASARPGYSTQTGRAAFLHLQMQAHLVEAPLLRLESALEPWVSFFIMPLFALTNAGIRLSGIHGSDFADPAMHGIFLGLLFGKPLGILLFSWLTVRFGIAHLPEGVTWKHMHAVGWLGGIGFTMSLFISALAFGTGEEDMLAKVGILSASALAAIVGSILLRSCRGINKHETDVRRS